MITSFVDDKRIKIGKKKKNMYDSNLVLRYRSQKAVFKLVWRPTSTTVSLLAYDHNRPLNLIQRL